jgi:hypothetical protein
MLLHKQVVYLHHLRNNEVLELAVLTLRANQFFNKLAKLLQTGAVEMSQQII